MRSKQNLVLTPEDAASGTRIVQMLHGPNDPFWHRRIARLFAKVGIGTRRLERRTDQNLWLALLTQGSFNLSPNKKVASGQMGKVLRNGNLKVMFGRVNIVERS